MSQICNSIFPQRVPGAGASPPPSDHTSRASSVACSALGFDESPPTAGDYRAVYLAPVRKSARVHRITHPFKDELGISRFFSGVKGDEDFPSHCGVFFISNEREILTTLDILEKESGKGDTVIGISGFFNFELFLNRASKGAKYLISIDPDPA